MPPSPRPRDPEESLDHAFRPLAQRHRVPSVLDLVRLSPDPVFPPGGEALYRQIALLTDLKRGDEVLDAACGRGISTIFFAANYATEAVGLDPDEVLITEADQRARTTGLEKQLHFQATPLHDLPYQDDVFDVSVGEVGLATSADPATAIRELARVTRPFGYVVLVQLVWTGNVPEDRREALVQHLGARPLLLVEWKQLLRDAGCVDLHVEDWSDQSGPFRPAARGPFHDLARLFTLRQKAAILRRAFKRWGWRGVRGAIVREQEIHRLLTRERVLGLTLIRSTKWVDSDETNEPEQRS